MLVFSGVDASWDVFWDSLVAWEPGGLCSGGGAL